MVESTEARGQWGSKLGFIMAAAGSAVGLGNIWRFPYLTGENGGGAFVLVYLLCVLLIGIPLLYNEVAIGRLTGKNPVGAMNKEKPKSFWVISGILTIFLCFFVLSYYSVIAGWTIGYIFSSLSGKAMDFGEFAANGSYTIGLMSVFLLMTIGIILGGVKGGIEKASKIMMPILLLLIILLIIRTLTLDGAMAGVKYYLIPDLSKINGKVVLQALGQAFFSMSVGWGLMVTYGSYVPKNQNLVSSGVWIAFIDTLVALLGGLLIFPAVFAFGKDPAGGVALVFQVLPEVFEQMPMGSIV
ncbi:MAG: sodium-dependent transporter, partial [Bacteroidia bacterium]|nr:sodium-dependent transporter [Bacteroidia bacterium]